VALGDVALDIVVSAPHGTGVGTDVPGTISFRAGGSAANSCRVFAGLGGGAWFVGAVGRDGLGTRLVGALRADKVKVHAVRVVAPSARLLVTLGAAGERSFVTQRGAADELQPRDLEGSWFAPADVLHLPAYSLLAEPLAAAAMSAVRMARDQGALVSVDLASHRPLMERGRSAARALIGGVAADVLFANRAEARSIAGGRGARSLLELAPVVVIKEGDAGCRVLWRPAGASPQDVVLEVTVATKPIDSVDTTGAGDAFDAGFLHSLVEQTLAERGRSRVGRRRRGGAVPLDRAAALRRAHVLRRAAVAGHRAATRLLTRPRRELVL